MKKYIRIALLFSLFLTSYHVLRAQGIDKPQYEIITHRAGVYLGTINIELFPLIAPLATQNFDSLVGVQFYDSTAFHRVVPGFVIQGGDPNSISGPVSTWGQGNANQPTVNAEFSVVRHYRGRLGAARDIDTNSANSQFYFCVANAFGLDGNYTVYGQVTSGMDIVDTIVNSPSDSNDVPLQKIEMFITFTGVNDSVPDAPVMITPPDQSLGIVPSSNFYWSHIDDAVLYNIEVSTDTAFSNIVYGRNVVTDSVKISGLNPHTSYYWRIKANNGGHESSYFAVYSFTTGTEPVPLIEPANGDTGIIRNPVCVWNSVPYANTYDLFVYKSLVFSASNLVYQQTGISDTTQQLPVLNPNTTYYWRVRGVEAGAPGFFSSVFSFKTGNTVGIDESSDGVKQMRIDRVYPNPANDRLNVSITVLRPGAIEISLMSMSGVCVYQSVESSTQLQNEYSLDIAKLKRGIYMLCISMNNHEERIKVEIN